MSDKPKLSPEFVAQQWQPGQSGNPKGRPKRPSFETIVANILDEEVPGSDRTKREMLARVFVDEMIKRNGAMIREYLAREWPATSKHEVTVDTSAEADALEAELASLASRRRTNGSAAGANGAGPNGSGRGSS